MRRFNGCGFRSFSDLELICPNKLESRYVRNGRNLLVSAVGDLMTIRTRVYACLLSTFRKSDFTRLNPVVRVQGKINIHVASYF